MPDELKREEYRLRYEVKCGSFYNSASDGVQLDRIVKDACNRFGASTVEISVNAWPITPDAEENGQ